MRKIKFKAWNINTKEIQDEFYFTEFNSVNDEFEAYEDEFVFMQYAGLIDKNGVEIYEGDIVRWGMNGAECWTRYAIVELSPCLQFKIIYYMDETTNEKKKSDTHVFGYSNFIYKDTEKHLEIIGNIYENPELLEKSAEV